MGGVSGTSDWLLHIGPYGGPAPASVANPRVPAGGGLQEGSWGWRPYRGLPPQRSPEAAAGPRRPRRRPQPPGWRSRLSQQLDDVVLAIPADNQFSFRVHLGIN